MNWTVVFVLGLLLELCGLGLGLKGVRTLRDDLFEGHDLPAQALSRRFWSATKAFLSPAGPKKRISARVRSVSAAGHASTSGSATAKIVGDRSDLQRWLRELGQQLEELRREVARDLASVRAHVDTSVATEQESRRAADDDLRELIRRGFGSGDGSGLDLAWWGLSLIGLGAVCQGVASMMTQ